MNDWGKVDAKWHSFLPVGDSLLSKFYPGELFYYCSNGALHVGKLGNSTYNKGARKIVSECLPVA